MRLSAAALASLNAELSEVNKALLEQEQALLEASDAGDNSQNGDIFTVFEEQSKLNTRLSEIERSITAHDNSPTPSGDLVEPGTLVEIKFAEDDVELMVFGSVEETKVHTHDVVTPQSPIGAAIAGSKPGDTVTVAGGASFTVTIGKVEVL